MPQNKILADSNCYFRLAQSIHPLLQTEFGLEKHCLYLVEDFDAEYIGQSRLENKFPWVTQPEYVANRKCKLNISRVQKKDINTNFGFLAGTAHSKGSNVSPVDIRALTVCLTLQIPCATDDASMLDLAKDFDINTMTTLELLDLMRKCNHCDMAKISQIVSYWKHSKDVPKNWKSDFKRLFGIGPPQ